MGQPVRVRVSPFAPLAHAPVIKNDDEEVTCRFHSRPQADWNAGSKWRSPPLQIDGEVAQRLNKISRTARLKGFRPGKAPLAVIRQQYGDQVHGEVINDLMRSSFSEAVAREKLNPATGPRIEPIAMSPGSDLKYAAVFEVLPEVRLRPVTDLTIEKPVASVERQGPGSHGRHFAQAAAGVQ